MTATQAHAAVLERPSPAARALLHPNYIVRVAGEPVGLMALTETGAAAAAVAARAALRRDIKGRADAACAILERLIPHLSATDRELSRRVLDLKRSIYNARRAKAGVVSSLAGLLGERDLAAVAAIVADVEALLAMDARVADAYAGEIAETGRNLPQIWQRPNLQDSISYSNPPLFRDYSALFSPSSRHWSEKKRRNLEDTLVQYAARCATKTSPLSSFTVLHVGSWDGGGRDSPALAYGGSLEKRVEFKAGLFHQLMSGLLRDYSAAKTLFPLALNPSTELADGKARFRKVSEGNTVSGRTWGTGEAIAELTVNGIVQCVLHVFRRAARPAMRSDELVGAVCALAPKLDPAAVDAFVGKLYDVGLLLPETGLREQADVLRWAGELFERMEGERGRECQSLVRALRQQLDSFGGAPPAERAALVEAIREGVDGLARALGVALTPTMASPTFFENCYLTAVERELSAAALEPFQEDLDLLLKLAPVVDGNQLVQTQFADYFLAAYGESGVCTAPFDLLAAFDEAYGVARFGFVPEPGALAPASPVLQELERAGAALDDYLAPLLESEDDVQLDRAALGEIVGRLPRAVVNRGASHSFLGQLCTAGGAPQLVVNQVFGGRSSLLSRFLEVLPESGLARVREYLTRTSREGAYAELPAVFGFNANRHPRLADAEVVIPPYASHWEESEKVALRDLRLTYDRHTHRVRFTRADGRALDVWYQGFLIPALLPRTQRVLALVGTEGVVHYVIGTVMRRRSVAPDAVSVIPRVTLGRIVLARRTYLVPRSVLPAPDLPALEFFVAMQEWRERHGVPNELFVRTSPVSAVGADAASPSDVNWSEFDFKNMKPSYVKLDSPRLVRLLARAMSRNDFPLIMTEVLPGVRDQHVTVAGARHVAEVHVELTAPPVRPELGAEG